MFNFSFPNKDFIPSKYILSYFGKIPKHYIQITFFFYLYLIGHSNLTFLSFLFFKMGKNQLILYTELYIAPI